MTSGSGMRYSSGAISLWGECTVNRKQFLAVLALCALGFGMALADEGNAKGFDLAMAQGFEPDAENIMGFRVKV